MTRNGRLSLWERLAPHFGIMLILIVVFLLYAPSLSNYLLGDDFEWLNSVYPAWRNPELLFEKINNFYRPLVKLSYLLNFAVSGNRVFAYNLLNILLHLGNLWLLFRLAIRLFRRAMPAFLAVVAYGVCPLYSEVTLWAAGRPDSILMLFILSALLLLARRKPEETRLPWRTHLWLGLLAIGAASTKESWVILPPLAFFFLWLVRGMPFRRAFTQTSGLFLLLGLYLGWAIGAPLLKGSAPFTRYGQANLGAMLDKAALLFWEFLGAGNLYRGDWWQYLLVIVLLSGSVIWLVRRRNRTALFGMVWLGLGIGVSLPVIYAASRYNYIPLMGFWLALVAGITVEYGEFVRRHDLLRRWTGIAIAVPLLVYLAVQSFWLQVEIRDYRLRGEMHRQLADKYNDVRSRIPRDEPFIFLDLGRRLAVRELAASIRGIEKHLFVRERAIWQQVFLAPLGNFLGTPFSHRLEEVDRSEWLPVLREKAVTLIFTDEGFAFAADERFRVKILERFSQSGKMPFKVQILRLRMLQGRS